MLFRISWRRGEPDARTMFAVCSSAILSVIMVGEFLLVVLQVARRGRTGIDLVGAREKAETREARRTEALSNRTRKGPNLIKVVRGARNAVGSSLRESKSWCPGSGKKN
mmetsp:Transcript_36574/g.85859  ORF Transcript_36574/g.85859 Transcript_36574/m.85859 type:complete len:109 (+) Transcript_36574:1889-2215(+)